MTKSKTPSYFIPTFNPNILTTLSNDNPRCNSCHNIYSLVHLNNELQTCDDCLAQAETQYSKLDDLKIEYEELETDLDRKIIECEDFESELNDLQEKYEDLKTELANSTAEIYNTNQEYVRLVDEYDKMHTLIQTMQNDNINHWELQEYQLLPIDRLNE